LSEITVPAVLSTHFSVGYFVPVDLLARITRQFDHVIGLNVTNPDINYLIEVSDAIDDHIELYTGMTTQALTALALGASGYLTSEANIVPRMCMAVIERFRAGDFAGTMAAYDRLLRFSEQLYRGAGSMRATKAALGLLGWAGGIPRRPRLPLSDDAALARLQQVIDSFDIRASEITSGT
jgi:4-hydroxy-tetrahydrodipicolinate synthase